MIQTRGSIHVIMFIAIIIIGISGCAQIVVQPEERLDGEFYSDSVQGKYGGIYLRTFLSIMNPALSDVL